MALAEEFAGIFRAEHRQVRDALLELIPAFQGRDGRAVQSLLMRVATLTGPHFRYEEEALYPSLVEIFGEDYVDKLMGDHDLAIGRAKKLVELAGKIPLANDDAAAAARHIRSILPHVSDCEGLSIMVERLAEPKVQAILDSRDIALREGLDLLTWASNVRGRSAAVVN